MVAVPIYIPMNSAERFLSTLFPAFIICRVFDYGHPDRCEVIPNCGFELSFLFPDICPGMGLLDHMAILFLVLVFLLFLIIFIEV